MEKNKKSSLLGNKFSEQVKHIRNFEKTHYAASQKFLIRTAGAEYNILRRKKKSVPDALQQGAILFFITL